MKLQIGDKVMLAAGYCGRRGKMGHRKATIEELARLQDSNIEVALVSFETAREPPRWVALVDLESR